MSEELLVCPIHDLPMRMEWSKEHTWRGTWYCERCAKHYPRCNIVRHMTMCVRIHGHEGRHLAHGVEWEEKP